MARLARVVLPKIPHLVTQRGNGRAQTFFSDEDYQAYMDLLVTHCSAHKVSIWGWCLMPNHVHMILTPKDKDGLRGALSRVHRTYAGMIHEREGRTGHFWQGRFGCVAMDERHLISAMAYVALNPVRAGLVARANEWAWSSIHAYEKPRKSDGVTDREAIAPYLKQAKAIIRKGEEDPYFDALRRAESIGRPVGDRSFMKKAERKTGRTLMPQKRGPKPAVND